MGLVDSDHPPLSSLSMACQTGPLAFLISAASLVSHIFRISPLPQLLPIAPPAVADPRLDRKGPYCKAKMNDGKVWVGGGQNDR